MSTTKKTHLPRAYALASLSALFFSSALLAEPLLDKSQFVRESLVTIPVPFTPFGNRVEFNRYGDDGSKCVLDANGVLTWIASDGTVRLLPGTSLAVPLFVTNTECLVWNNRFVDYNNYPSRPKAEIKLFRAAPGSTVVTTQSVTTQGTEVIDTPPVTTTTGTLTFVTTTRLDDGAEGLFERQADVCDMRVYRLTFDAGVQFVRSLTNIIRGESAVFENTVAGPGATAFGYGSDGSIVVKLPDVGVATELDTRGEDHYYWFDSQGRSVKLVIPNPPFFVPPTVEESINQVLFTSNTRLVYVDEDDALKESRRSASTGNLNGLPTPIPLATVGEKVLDLANYVRVGDKKYIYTLDDSDKKTVRTYLLGSTAVLQSTTVLADTISPDAVTGTINPSDGSALLVDEDSASLIWLHSNGHSLVGTIESKALFVSNEQAVIWDNAGASPNGNGVLPAAVVKHFSRTLADPAVLTSTVVKSTGSNLLNTSRITPDFDNWFFTTSSKPSASTALFATYQLASNEIAQIDTDGDGIIDYYELNPPPGIPATNPNLADTDGDGINDGDEVNIYQTDPTVRNIFAGVPILPSPVGNVPFIDIANTYYHLVYDPKQGRIGMMTVKLSTKGAFTYEFKGLNDKIKASGRGAFSGNGAYSGPGPKGLSDVTSLDMQMVQESGIWEMRAVMTRNNGELGSVGLPPKYGKSNPYPVPGAFTMALPLAGPAVTGVTEPSGEGVATGSINRAGTVKANYILPNGKRSTSSGPILGNDYTVVHASTSKGSKSALVGAFDMGSPRPSLDYGGTLRLYAEASTVKGQATTAIDQIRLVEGSVYIPPAKGLAPLSNLSLAGWNISFNMLEGAFDGVSKVSAWGANNKIVIPPSPTTASKAGYNPKTGLMTFGHTETDPILNTSTTANGYAVVLQRPDQTRGYYLTQFSSGRLSVTKHDGSAPPLTMISPVARTVPVGASVYNVQVSTPGAWQVILPEDPWVSVEIVQGGTEGLNGNGNGIVRITVEENPTIPLIWRSLTIEIAGIKHNISQDYMQRR
jgi:hypothetical protein